MTTPQVDRMPELWPFIAFYWLLGVAVFEGVRRLEHASLHEGDRGPAYHAGLKSGVFLKCLSWFVAGLYAVDGSVVALFVLTFLVTWSGIKKASSIGQSFGAGIERASGHFPRGLAATIGLLVVVVTRGIPLVVMARGG